MAQRMTEDHLTALLERALEGNTIALRIIVDETRRARESEANHERRLTELGEEYGRASARAASGVRERKGDAEAVAQ